MDFKNKQEQYEWWTATIQKIQNHQKSLRAGCRELGVQFWQYYEWKERVQEFVNSGKVELSEKEKSCLPKGPKIQSLGFVELTESFEKTSAVDKKLLLHYKEIWTLVIPDGFSSSTLQEILKMLSEL